MNLPKTMNGPSRSRLQRHAEEPTDDAASAARSGEEGARAKARAEEAM